MVDFPGSYHAILGRPCYAKFMAIPNYTYFKLKMSGPNGVITIGSTFSHAYMCDHEHYELATAVINSAELLSSGIQRLQKSLTATGQPPQVPSIRLRKPRWWRLTPLT